MKPLETFLGKSESCMMTAMSGAFDKSVFDENTILLEKGEKNDKHRYVYIVGNMICSFLTKDKKYKYISSMGNNLTPYILAISGENISFLSPHFEFIEREKFIDNELLKTNKDNVDRFNYRVSNCGIHSFKKVRIYKIHSIFD